MSSRRALAALTLALAAACGGAPEAPFAVGGPAPAFELPRLDGGELASAELAGRPAVINFWATWCQPCRREIPELSALAASGEARVVGIALDEGREEGVAEFVRDHEISYPVLLGNEEVFRAFDGLTIPYTVVLDAASQVVAAHRGPITSDVLRSDLEP